MNYAFDVGNILGHIFQFYCAKYLKTFKKLFHRKFRVSTTSRKQNFFLCFFVRIHATFTNVQMRILFEFLTKLKNAQIQHQQKIVCEVNIGITNFSIADIYQKREILLNKKNVNPMNVKDQKQNSYLKKSHVALYQLLSTQQFLFTNSSSQNRSLNSDGPLDLNFT